MIAAQAVSKIHNRIEARFWVADSLKAFRDIHFALEAMLTTLHAPERCALCGEPFPMHLTWDRVCPVAAVRCDRLEGDVLPWHNVATEPPVGCFRKQLSTPTRTAIAHIAVAITRSVERRAWFTPVGWGVAFADIESAIRDMMRQLR